MSNKVQHYSLYEGNFLTTAPVLDRSVNVLMFRDPDNQEYNLIINRATLDEEQTPEAFCESQMDILRNKLPGFQLEGKMLRHETGPSRLPVVQIANRYLQEGKTSYHFTLPLILRTGKSLFSPSTPRRTSRNISVNTTCRSLIVLIRTSRRWRNRVNRTEQRNEAHRPHFLFLYAFIQEMCG